MINVKGMKMYEKTRIFNMAYDFDVVCDNTDTSNTRLRIPGADGSNTIR